MNVFALFLLFFFFEDGLCGPKNVPQCPQIKLRFGRVRYRQRGKIARFMCNTGYMLAGDRYSACIQGQWDNTPPKCVRSTCKAVKPPANGLIYPSHSGAVLNFFCKSNYELKGANITYCDGDMWDNPLPTCQPTNSTPSLSCDFEREDICGWNHDPNHDFDWTRLNYGTPSSSIGTGPTFDHTKGKGKDGYYMYIESSARHTNDTARLISPIFDKSPLQNVCFEFFYHMFGVTTGDLRVFLKKVTETWNLLPKNAIFAKNGNQGNRWYRAVLDLGVIDEDYQIIIEGVRGPGYVSDIAIDDVRIIPDCIYEDQLLSTTEEPSLTSEQPISVESCENRCQTNDTQKIDFLITCDCDDRCFERNRCCPDYFDFCVFTSIDDFVDETTWSLAPDVTSTTAKSSPTTTTPPRQLTTATTVKLVTTKRRDSKIVYVTPPSDMATLTPITEEEVTPESPTKEFEPAEADSDKSVTQRIIIPIKAAENNTKTVIFAVGVVFGALIAVSGMAFVAKRYRLFQCLNLRRFNHSSNGDSQSDVRFLTGEEVLDLNLPSDYHTL